jgi:hypothetical protein
MTITKCDLCGKDISTANDVVKVGYRTYGLLASEFCASCGKPVALFLQRLEKMKKGKKP